MADNDEALQFISTKGSSRDPEIVRRTLRDWLAPRIAPNGGLELSPIELPEGTGVANETLMCDGRWTEGGRERSEGFVVRIASEQSLYIEADIEVHHDMYAALADVPGVPVPRVHGYEADPGLLGAPFFVMERIVGQVPADQPPWATAGFVFEAGPDERRTMWDNAVAVLAALHQVDAATFPFLAPPAGRSGLADHLAYWRRYLDDAAAGSPHDTLEHGYEWLTANMPDPSPTGLSWGDSRFANIMFRGTDVVAIFDWDTVSLAGAEADLAWWRFMDGPNSALPGIGTADDLVTRWQELTGRQATNLHYYDLFTTFRLGAILLRLFAQMGASGAIPPEVADEQGRNSAQVQALAAQLREVE